MPLQEEAITINPKVGTSNIFGFCIDEKISEEEIIQAQEALEKAIHKYGRLKVLVQIYQENENKTDQIMEELSMFSFQSPQIEKVAVIGEKIWQKHISQKEHLFSFSEMKFFEHSKAAKAWEWISK